MAVLRYVFSLSNKKLERLRRELEVIRKVESLGDPHPGPELMGLFCIRRDPFTALGPDKASKMREENERRRGEEAQYHFTMFIQQKYGGKGIVTVSLAFVNQLSSFEKPLASSPCCVRESSLYWPPQICSIADSVSNY